MSDGGLQVCNSADFPSLLVFYASPISGQTPDTATSQSGVQNLVSLLISALQEYQNQNTASHFNSTADFAASDDTGTEPVVDAIELVDDLADTGL